MPTPPQRRAKWAEHHGAITWDRLAEISGQHLGKRQLVAVEGRLQTRSWDDESGRRHWRTEIVAERLEMLSGRGKGVLREAAADLAGPAVRTPAGSSGEA